MMGAGLVGRPRAKPGLRPVRPTDDGASEWRRDLANYLRRNPSLLVGGHVPSVTASAPTATGFMRDGRIRALAATGAKRSPFDPDVPTVAELGFPGYVATNWYAVVVSSRTPPETCR